MIFTSDEWSMVEDYFTLEPQSMLGDYLCRKAYIIDMSNEEMYSFIKGHLVKRVNSKEENNVGPKRLFKIGSYNTNNGILDYSRIRDLTESEALKWYSEYTPESYEKKAKLLYKKDGEWVEYEEIN